MTSLAHSSSFLPLSFFTSLFGINAREWSGTPENLSLTEMFEIGGTSHSESHPYHPFHTNKCSAPASFAIIIIALLLAFSSSLRQAVTKSHKISRGLMAEFIANPVKLFLRWESFKSKIPSVVPAEDSAMRKRFDQYLGYSNHWTKFEEDFWQRRQVERSPLEELERRKRKRVKSMSMANGWGASLAEKVGRVSDGGLNV